MIVLDTDVVSALMRSEPDPIVVEWLDSLPPESIWTTSVTVFEVRLGLKILVAGRRQLDPGRRDRPSKRRFAPPCRARPW